MVNDSHNDGTDVIKFVDDGVRVEVTTFDPTTTYHRISDEKLEALVNKAQPWQWDVFLLAVAIAIGFLQNIYSCAVSIWGANPQIPSGWDAFTAAIGLIAAGVAVACLITALSGKNSAKKMLAAIRGRPVQKREIGAL